MAQSTLQLDLGNRFQVASVFVHMVAAVWWSMSLGVAGRYAPVAVGLLVAAVVAVALLRRLTASAVVLPIIGAASAAWVVLAAQGAPQAHIMLFTHLVTLVGYRSAFPLLVAVGVQFAVQLAATQAQLGGAGVHWSVTASWGSTAAECGLLLVMLGIVLRVGATLRDSQKSAQEVSALFEHVLRNPTHFDLNVASIAVASPFAQQARECLLALNQIVSATASTAVEVDAASRQLMSGQDQLTERTTRQTDRLQQTASSMEELARSVQHNASVAGQADDLAAQAVQAATHSREAVGTMVNTMQGIAQASARIGEIVGVIDSIAFQTNILALNAAVEAARAGEQGRGFAVVASEVRALAQKSALSAKEIRALVGRSTAQVGHGSELAAAAGSQVDHLANDVQHVATLIKEISQASREQSSGIVSVNAAVADVDRLTQANATLVQEATASTHALRSHTEALREQLQHFDGAVAQRA